MWAPSSSPKYISASEAEDLKLGDLVRGLGLQEERNDVGLGVVLWGINWKVNTGWIKQYLDNSGKGDRNKSCTFIVEREFWTSLGKVLWPQMENVSSGGIGEENDEGRRFICGLRGRVLCLPGKYFTLLNPCCRPRGCFRREDPEIK